jgi:hypothetical protein
MVVVQVEVFFDGIITDRADNVQHHVRILPGNQHKRVHQHMHSLVRRNGAAIKDALYLALPQSGVILFSGKLLRINTVVGCLAAIGKRREGALGLLCDVVAY